MGRFAVLLFVVGASWFCAGAAYAETTISIVEAGTLTFPTIGIPQSGTSTLAISPMNSSTSGNAEVIYGAASRGVYHLSSEGEGGVSISIDVAVTNTGTSGASLGTFKGLYGGTSIDSFPSQSLPIPAPKPSSTPLYLGATVSAGPSVHVGSSTGTLAITVFVQ